MVWDRDLLADPQIRQHFADQGIILTNWHEVMERFEGRLPAELKDEAVEEVEVPETKPAIETEVEAPRHLEKQSVEETQEKLEKLLDQVR